MTSLPEEEEAESQDPLLDSIWERWTVPCALRPLSSISWKVSLQRLAQGKLVPNTRVFLGREVASLLPHYILWAKASCGEEHGRRDSTHLTLEVLFL
jgi:hypothetical protein